MSSHTPEKLVYMANQIARNIGHEADPVGTLRQHIKDFWTPRMKDMIFALDGEGLDPIAREGIAQLAREYQAAHAG